MIIDGEGLIGDLVVDWHILKILLWIMVENNSLD